MREPDGKGEFPPPVTNKTKEEEATDNKKSFEITWTIEESRNWQWP